MSNTATLIPAVYAEANTKANELPAITLDKEVEDQPKINQDVNEENLTTKEKVVQFVNQLIPYYAQNGKQQGPDWLRTTDINFTFNDDFKPVYSIETIQPFSNKIADGKLAFWQGRYAYQSGTSSTVNLGVGLRWLSEDKRSMTGINTFYDYAFEHNLSRVGIGAEYFNKQAEYRANFYIPTSGDKQTGATNVAGGMLYSYIRAVSGFDYEVGTTFKHAPWLSLYASGFHYDNKHKEDENGYRLRSNMQLTPRISMEIGYTESNLSNGSAYGKFLYNLADAAKPSLHGNNPERIAKDISYKLLQKVQRENDIKTETFSKLVAYTGDLSVTVTNNNGAALQGVQVQAYQNGSPVGAVVVTDANGTAVLSGLATGDYTVHADYFNISGNSQIVTVEKDKTANTSISLAIAGGKALVNVIDDAGMGIGGATVIAETVGKLYTAEKSLFDKILGVKTAYAASAFTITAVTDANGRVIFDNLPSGNYKFRVIYNGKEMKSLGLNIANGSTSNSTVVLPASGGNIVAKIIDAVSQAVINGATVELKSDSNVIETKNTGNDGTVTFSGLTAGLNYTLTASAANYISKNISPTVTDKETTAEELALTPQGGGANITVKDESNTPINEATVSVTVDGKVQTKTTDANGVATFANLPIGTYIFTAAKETYNSSTTSVVISNGTTAASAISLARETGTANITVTDGANILKDAEVSVTVNGKQIKVKTNDEGVATFSALPIGKYTFTATKEGYGSNASKEITVQKGATATENIALVREIGAATIMVTFHDGSARLNDATVSVTVNGQVQTATTDTNGEANFTNLPTGTYNFTASKSGFDDNTSNNVVIKSGITTTARIDLTLQRGKATITVIDDVTKAPISKVSVVANNRDSNTVSQAVETNEQGIVNFDSLLIGKYAFIAKKDGYDDKTSPEITIEKGATVTPTIALTRQTGTVNIKVTDGNNALLSGAKVIATLSGSKVKEITTQADGKAEFIKLPTGTYEFTVSKENYNSNTASVTINSGDVIDKTIALRQTGGAIITVTDGSAKLSGVKVVATLGGSKVQEATTQDNGEATFADLPIGTYNFTASKDGYTGGSADGVAITNNNITKPASIVLTRQTGNKTYKITDDQGAPLSGVTVSTTVDGSKVEVITEGDGLAKFTNLPTGEYSFSANKDGYSNWGTSRVPITSGDNETKTITLRLKAGNATITVMGPNGTERLTDAQVQVTGNGKDITVPTDNIGEAKFTRLPVGTYTFKVTKSGYDEATFNAEITDDTTFKKTITLTKQTLGKATITVTDNATPPAKISGATVTVKEKGTNNTIDTQYTSWSGIATFGNIPNGTYTVTVDKDGYDSASLDLVVNGGSQSPTITLTRQCGKAVVVVTDKSDTTKYVEGATVTIKSLGGNPIILPTGSNGSVSFENLPVGAYNVSVAKDNYVTSTNNSINVNKDKTTTQVVEIIPTKATIKIMLIDDIAGIPGGKITMTHIETKQVFTGTTEKYNWLTFPNAPLGKYSIRAEVAGYSIAIVERDFIIGQLEQMINMRYNKL